MSFLTLQFAYFLAIVFGLWLAVRGRYGPTIALLLAASLMFYGYRHWWVVPIILGYCVVDWLVGLALTRTPRRRLVVALGVGFNLAVLSFWKYTPLLLETAAWALGWPALRIEPVVASNWVIPVGISFYAFTGIAYMADVYRGVVPAETSLWRFALFMTFFPHLVAGPILRAQEFLTHLRPETLPNRSLAAAEGAVLLARGLFKKMVLADSIAHAVDPFFAHVSDASTAGVWALPYVYLYAFQIYFDFSGYTDIARGLGLWFGFRWPENFDRPYLAASVREFWRRWHMTLSRFLRDYLYIPLGGGRHGRARTAANLMLTMLLGGLWHGASWSFMLWGGLHGCYLIINHLWGETGLAARLASMRGLPALAWRWLCIALTFHAVCFAWCFFRLTQLADSLACVRKWIDFDLDKAFVGGSADVALWSLVAAYGLASLAAHLLTRGAPLPQVAERLTARPFAGGLIWGGSLGVFALALLLSPGGETPPFIYFRF